MLGRRGEDQRFDESRPAARRRRELEEAMAERAAGETRADVARRRDRPESAPESAPESDPESDPES
jgi:GTP-binding protein